jgi:hypothetical protein
MITRRFDGIDLHQVHERVPVMGLVQGKKFGDLVGNSRWDSFLVSRLGGSDGLGEAGGQLAAQAFGDCATKQRLTGREV